MFRMFREHDFLTIWKLAKGLAFNKPGKDPSGASSDGSITSTCICKAMAKRSKPNLLCI